MKGMKVLALVAAIAGSVPACAPRASSYGESAQPAARAVTIQVKNDNMLAMDIFAVSGGNTHRLGSVGPGLHDTLVLDPGLLPTGIVEIVARPTGGGRSVSSGALNPWPGQTVEFLIGLNLGESRATIR